MLFFLFIKMDVVFCSKRERKRVFVCVCINVVCEVKCVKSREMYEKKEGREKETELSLILISR